MRLIVAFKAFIKALKQPQKALLFLNDKPSSIEPIHRADSSHLQLLNSLQASSRLIDFIKEDLSSFSDAQVGAAARKIHNDCAAHLEEIVTIRPLKEEEEGSVVQILKGYDPSQIKITGLVKGEPPFTGILVHRGWKAHKLKLPPRTNESSFSIICPAEIEIKPYR